MPEPSKEKTSSRPKASVVVAGARRKRSEESARRHAPGISVRSIAAGVFVFAACFMAMTMVLARVWPNGWSVLIEPGRLLSGIFAWAAWFLPFWCLWAAILVYVPVFLPRLTYLLGVIALPFLVVTAFARISTNPAGFFLSHPAMARVGLSSLYAGLGFLFAASLFLVGAGFARLTVWLKAHGYIKEKDKKGSTREGPGLGSRISEFLRHALERREEKRERKRQEKLEKARMFAQQPVSVNIPDVPPPDPKLRQQPEQTPASQSAGSPNPVTAASETASGSRPATPADGKGSSDTSGKQAQPAGDIAFTSVPPSHVAGRADDAQKRSIVEQIIERRILKTYQVPVDGLLNTYPDGQYWIIDDKTRANAAVLKATLAEFGIDAEVTGIRKGPVITMFEILPAHGVKISKITNLSDNIALRLAASSVRIVAPIPGKHAVGIEVPNERRSIVSLRELIEHEQFRQSKMEIPVALGKDIAGEVQVIDLTQMPHVLIAGATGSGKSVCVNSIILSILYRRSPEEVKLMLIDPKIVELKLYNDIPHLMTPVITEPKKAFQALQYCICEMERRYSMLDKLAVRDIRSYNRRIKERNLAQEKLPYIVVIIDEFADLMATTGKELESTIARLAAMSRAVGIHLVLATQRPSVDVITGLIKANIPSRIAFMVASKFDSRTIIDMVGAEKLLGRGDMLYSGAQDPFPVRLQGAFVSEEEVERVVAHVKTLGEPEYIDDEIFIDEEELDEPTLFDEGSDSDPLFEKALEIVLQQGKASVSYIQRRLKIGFNRAARLVEMMEERGIVGPAQGSRPRDVLRNPEVFDSSVSHAARMSSGRQESGDAGDKNEED